MDLLNTIRKHIRSNGKRRSKQPRSGSPEDSKLHAELTAPHVAKKQPKQRKSPPNPAGSAINANILMLWFQAIMEAGGHGAKAQAAEKLGLTPSAVSKLLHDPTRRFDEKTLRAVAWCATSKSELYDETLFPIEGSLRIKGIIVDIRRAPDGTEFQTWRPA